MYSVLDELNDAPPLLDILSTAAAQLTYDLFIFLLPLWLTLYL